MDDVGGIVARLEHAGTPNSPGNGGFPQGMTLLRSQSSHLDLLKLKLMIETRLIVSNIWYEHGDVVQLCAGLDWG